MPPMTHTANTAGSTKRSFMMRRPQPAMEGTRFLWRVFSMPRLKSISRPGMSRNTDSMEQTMPLDRTIPMSKPMRNCISIRATRPEIVVREEEEISTMALLRAAMSASRASRPLSRSSI